MGRAGQCCPGGAPQLQGQAGQAQIAVGVTENKYLHGWPFTARLTPPARQLALKNGTTLAQAQRALGAAGDDLLRIQVWRGCSLRMPLCACSFAGWVVLMAIFIIFFLPEPKGIPVPPLGSRMPPFQHTHIDGCTPALLKPRSRACRLLPTASAGGVCRWRGSGGGGHQCRGRQPQLFGQRRREQQQRRRRPIRVCQAAGPAHQVSWLGEGSLQGRLGCVARHAAQLPQRTLAKPNLCSAHLAAAGRRLADLGPLANYTPGRIQLNAVHPLPCHRREEIGLAWGRHANDGDYTTAALIWLERCGRGEACRSWHAWAGCLRCAFCRPVLPVPHLDWRVDVCVDACNIACAVRSRLISFRSLAPLSAEPLPLAAVLPILHPMPRSQLPQPGRALGARRSRQPVASAPGGGRRGPGCLAHLQRSNRQAAADDASQRWRWAEARC